jgi:hypothetical protein
LFSFCCCLFALTFVVSFPLFVQTNFECRRLKRRPPVANSPTSEIDSDGPPAAISASDSDSSDTDTDEAGSTIPLPTIPLPTLPVTFS